MGGFVSETKAGKDTKQELLNKLLVYISPVAKEKKKTKKSQ